MIPPLLPSGFGLRNQYIFDIIDGKWLSFKIKQKMKENHQQTWLQEPQHDYLFRSCKGSNQVNESAAHLWLKNSSFLLHAEGYLSVIQKEEIFTRSRKSKSLTNEHINPNCRFCGNQKETMQHISASCPSLRASI